MIRSFSQLPEFRKLHNLGSNGKPLPKIDPYEHYKAKQTGVTYSIYFKGALIWRNATKESRKKVMDDFNEKIPRLIAHGLPIGIVEAPLPYKIDKVGSLFHLSKQDDYGWLFMESHQKKGFLLFRVEQLLGFHD
jgi:hypothetical protein